MCIPYRESATGKWARLFPDFVFIHSVDGELKPSIVDPHGIQLADWRDKLNGYLDYADKHSDRFRSINPITEIDGKVLALAIHNSKTRSDVRAALSANESVEHVFRQFGVDYMTS